MKDFIEFLGDWIWECLTYIRYFIYCVAVSAILSIFVKSTFLIYFGLFVVLPILFYLDDKYISRNKGE